MAGIREMHGRRHIQKYNEMDKRFVGIVTWTNSSNYGTELQAYATSEVVRQLGYKPFFVRWFDERDFSIERQLSLYLVRRKEKKRLYEEFADVAKYRRTFSFEKKFFRYAPRLFSSFCLKVMNKKTRCYISGSDQILNPNFACPCYFLAFSNGVRKISYASSIGVNDIPKDKQEAYKEGLKTFYAISCREDTGARVLMQLLNRNVVKVLDPTLLLNKKDWQTVIESADVSDFRYINEDYILCYFVGDNLWYWEEINKIRRDTGIVNVVILPMQIGQKFQDGYHYTTAGPAEFLWLIEHSSLVCTDSFHATAFCLNFKKQFVEFKRFSDNDGNSQNSRIYDLLSFAGIEMMNGNVICCKDIDFSDVENRIEIDRNFSMDYLKNAMDFNN